MKDASVGVMRIEKVQNHFEKGRGETQSSKSRHLGEPKEKSLRG